MGPGSLAPPGGDHVRVTVVLTESRAMSQHRTARRTSRLVPLVVAGLCGVLWAVSACSPTNADEPPASSTPSSEDASSTAQPPLKYVALGDSFVSAPLVPVTDVANGCFRSSGNYPSLVARELGAELDDRSCGGARIIHLRKSEFPDVPAQLTAVKPGVDVVSIGIGGNDEDVFDGLTKRCPALRSKDPDGAPCMAAMRSGGDVLLRALERTRKRLTAALGEVRRRAPEARILVVGYPQIVSADNACDLLPLARGDYAYAEKVNLALTEALRSAAKATRSTYVDVWAASQGHDVCSEDPWFNGSVNDQKRAAAYHPFAEEQAAVADLVVAAIHN